MNQQADLANPRIVAAKLAPAPHDIPQEFIKAAVAQQFAGQIDDLTKALAVFDNSRIQRRQFIRPPDWYNQPHSWTERNRVFQEDGLELMVEAAQTCLAAASCQSQDVDQIIFVTSTGFSTPTLDAYLANRLDIHPAGGRLPIWGLGCAAGAAGVSRAADHCRAHPRSRVLLVALELCSLAFMTGDLSKKNLVATSLFGDGAAAVLLAGAETEGEGPRVLASRSHLLPDSYDVMGWDFVDEGMRLVLSPQLPAIVSQQLAPLVEQFLKEHGLRLNELRHFISHPGGARVLDAYREVLQLGDEEMALSEAVLAEHGNMSSVTVLAVLAKWLEETGSRRGFGLLSAFGPGFSAELLLLDA